MLLCGMFMVRIAFPTVGSCSNFLSLVWGVFVWTTQHTFIPIDIGGCASCFVLATRLLFKVGGFQTADASSFYICASPQNFLDVFPTSMQVLHAAPTSTHQITVFLALCFQTYLGIHPPLSIHHMLASLLPLLSRNTVI